MVSSAVTVTTIHGTEEFLLQHLLQTIAEKWALNNIE